MNARPYKCRNAARVDRVLIGPNYQVIKSKLLKRLYRYLWHLENMRLVGILIVFVPARILKRKGNIWKHQCIRLEFLPNHVNSLVWRRVRLTANWELFNCYHICAYILAEVYTHIEKCITDRYDGSGRFSSPTDRWAYVNALSRLDKKHAFATIGGTPDRNIP